MQIPSSVFWRGHTSLGKLSLLLKVALLGSQLRIGRVVGLVTCAIVGGAPHQHEVQVPLPYPPPLAFSPVKAGATGSDLQRDFPQTVRCPRQHCDSNSLTAEADTASAADFSHIVLYTESSLCEQTMPAATSLAGVSKSVPAVSSENLDLGALCGSKREGSGVLDTLNELLEEVTREI